MNYDYLPGDHSALVSLLASRDERIRELEADYARLQANYEFACDRIAAQSELLSKRAEK